MPLMSPLTDILRLSKQTAFFAFQMGDALSNQMTPLSGTLMTALAFAGIPYQKWIKLFAKLMLWCVLASSIFMVIAVLINYGPF